MESEEVQTWLKKYCSPTEMALMAERLRYLPEFDLLGQVGRTVLDLGEFLKSCDINFSPRTT